VPFPPPIGPKGIGFPGELFSNKSGWVSFGPNHARTTNFPPGENIENSFSNKQKALKWALLFLPRESRAASPITRPLRKMSAETKLPSGFGLPGGWPL